MRHTIYKLFFAWDFEKEEKWLNKMSARGLQMVYAGILKHVFEENDNVRYTYRMELLDNLPSHYKSTSYIRFLEETGAEYVCSVLRWAYFRKNVKDGEFEIYSDVESKIKHYKRIIYLLLAVTPINAINAVNMLIRYMEKGISAYLMLGMFSLILTGLLLTGILKVAGQVRKLKKARFVSE